MAANLFPVSGSKIDIGRRRLPKALLTPADFVGATWVEIGGWTQAGAIGDTQELISQSVISEGRVRKIKGLLDGGMTENTFLPDATDPGQIAFKAAIPDLRPYEFRIRWAGSIDEAVVTITAATPHVISWTNHLLVAGQAIQLTTTGTLPGTLSTTATYYVSATGLTADSFQISATPGGAPLGGAGAGTGTHIAKATAVGQINMFQGLAMPGARQGGEANASQLRTWSIAIDSNIVEI